MNLSRRRQVGVGIIEIIIIIAVLLLIIGGIWYALIGGKKPVATPAPDVVEQKPEKFIWQPSASGWQVTEKPPDCPAQPMLSMPTAIEKVTSVLYPGQKRGGNYKPHGGFRMDSSANNTITVVAPIDGYVVRGSSYIEQGEIQYMFDFMNNCGIMYRFDHLAEISPTLKKTTETWPAPQSNDSRTQQIPTTVRVKAGEVLATKVGFSRTKNSTFDFGVYDYRAQNEVSRSASYQLAHKQDKELAWQAVCWLDWMPEADKKILRALPSGDPASGKISDYCR